MTSAAFDVLGIGNAIVDVISRSEEAFLGRNGLVKGSMMLIDEARAEALYAAMGPCVEVSGGSCGNTMAGVASFGGKGAYIGKVRNDQLGSVFGHDLKATGVSFETPSATTGPATARCLILVTPDAQRTMNTYLGACTGLGPNDIDVKRMASAKVTYVEGYLWDAPAAKQAVLKAFDAARREGKIAALTRSEKGSVVVKGSETHAVPAAPVAKVVDTTGAGDLYAAGFLFGLTHGKPLAECARLGGIAAAEIISHVGARPEQALKALI